MTTPADRLPSIYRFADLTLDVARRRVTRAGPADRAQSARLRLAALPRGVGAERRERRRSGREGLGPALREPRERGAARDAAAAEPRRRRESAALHRDGSQQGLPAHPGRGDERRRTKPARTPRPPLARPGRRGVCCSPSASPQPRATGSPARPNGRRRRRAPSPCCRSRT